MPNPKPRYLGDGVYASFDGYHVQLHLGDHRSPPVVALEPEVIDQLNAYVEDVKSELEENSTSAEPTNENPPS